MSHPIGVRKLSSGKFQARIKVFLKTKYLGTFATQKLAQTAYLKAKKDLHKWE